MQRRFRRLGQIYGTLEVMQTERQALARKFLDSEEGQRIIEQRLAREVEQRAAQLDAEVHKLRADLVSERQQLAEQLEMTKANQAKEKRRLEEELSRLEKKRTEQLQAIEQLKGMMHQGVDQLGARLQDEFPLLAAIGGRATGPLVVEGLVAAPAR